ncbi:LysR family transcriptional regulator [Actinoplanes friuliensis]|uniref:LysR family transcriptional regulator n=1 Tax=Actinoplanes friuliensis DSM 7358 TaxID=1246995 RepID=U5W1J6_9ACTN|nr:LysR family transcriptional regulator [Actinoplanes friuliensis]AGZ41850.1 LysR family transcriptional regulator [Actinoplanes friuliensis DSM 7358]
MLDLHRLRIFRAVVASGSVNAAAANLGYTASAVSQHVTALQRETGLVLLSRNGRGIQPTSAGLALAREADGVLTRLGDVEAFVADLRDGRTGSLSMAYFPSVGAAWLPTVARVLLREFPDIRLDLELRDDPPTGAGKRPDVQIMVSHRDYTGTRDARAEHLIDDPYVVVLPKDHPLAGEDTVDLGRLAGERWIDNDFARGWCRRNLVEACRAAGFSPPFRVEAHDYPTAIAFVAAGIGVTVLPRLGAATLPGGVVAVPVTGPVVQRSIYALVQTAVASTPPVRCVVETLARCALTA